MDKNNFRILRKKIGLNQEQMGAKYGLKKGTWGFYERGRIPEKEKLLIIATTEEKEGYIGLDWLLFDRGKQFHKKAPKEKDEYISRKFYQREEDRELIAFRDKLIECFVDVSNSHSHIWEEIIRLKNNENEKK